MGKEHGNEQDPYWNDDQILAEDVMVERSPHIVRAKIHVSEERYPARHGHTEILPISDEPGIRDYVMIHPYISVLDFRTTIRLFPPPLDPSEPDLIGEVTKSEWEGMRHIQIGSGQAWHYRGDNLLVLWELELYPHFETSPDPNEDPTFIALWKGFEGYLTSRFPTAQRIATPSWEPGVDTSLWQNFLTNRGYSSATPQAFIKQTQ
jgi:hypothetical protein